MNKVVSTDQCILIVDTDARVLSALTRRLEPAGYHIETAQNCEAAADLCFQYNFDLGIIDSSYMNIAGSGYFAEVCRTCPSLTFIIMVENDVKTEFRKNVFAYLPKPIDTEVLVFMVNSFFASLKKAEKTGRTGSMSPDRARREKEKPGLVSIITHDLRTPLASIKGYASMLLDYEQKMTPETRRESLGSIIRATDQLVELIDQAAELSGFKSGAVHLEKSPARLRGIIIAAMTEACMRAPEYRFTRNLGKIPSQVKVDERCIREVIDILIRNAVDVSPPGSLVSLEAHAGKGEVIVSVKDEGLGIPDERTELSPDRFSPGGRLDDTCGLSLGISLCKTIIELHGGRIWMEKNQGAGNTYFFSLPLASS